ncbi:MAG: energy-coupling factor transporter transmembrane component T [Candidatus Bathyarchaeia archaeon]|nr:energy-coupling factor transporter transmembrane protein EcfT [Candidatus Bathyarchaeota archaeon]
MSLRVFDGFKFKKLDTPIHKMDPRSKFMFVTVIFVLTLLFTNLICLIILLLLQLPLILIAKCGRKWLKTMKGTAFFAILIFIMNFITGSSFAFSLAMTIRFLTLVSSFSLFFMTTSPDDLGLALEQMKIPYTVVFTFTTAVRLVPTIAVDAQTVIDAQKSRGLELEKGNLMKRVKNFIPILIPLIVSAIRRSMELAEALESRGFNASKKRTSYITLKLRKLDYITLFLTILLLASGVYVKFYIALPQIDLPLKIPSIHFFAKLFKELNKEILLIFR